MGSLVYVAGKGRDRSFTREKRLEVARRCGIKFIELEWNEPIDTRVKVEGFQSVRCALTTRPGSKQPVRIVEWFKDATGEDRPNGQLVFYPDEMNIARAWLPDSPFNRKKLAAQLLGGIQLFRIVDEKIAAEIEELAKAIEQSEEYKRGCEEIRQYQLDAAAKREAAAKTGNTVEGERLLQEQRRLEKQLEELLAAKKIKELREQIARLSGDTTTPEEEAAAAVKKRVVTEVHNENAELIADLKKKHRNYWKSAEYQEKIQPIIDERLRRDGHDNQPTNTGNDNQE